MLGEMGCLSLGADSKKTEWDLDLTQISVLSRVVRCMTTYALFSLAKMSRQLTCATTLFFLPKSAFAHRRGVNYILIF